MQSPNVIRFPGSGSAQEPDALAAMPGLVGEPQWHRSSDGGWWLTVLADGVCAHASLRQEASGRWTGSVSRTRRRGWQHENDIDVGGSLIAALRKAELAIAAMANSTM
jgi:hypothetical protein